MTKSIFIIGIPRSGTTWILMILSNHVDCQRVTAEMLGIKTDLPTLETGLFMRGFSDEEILKRWSFLPKDLILIEKTPGHIFETKKIKRLLNAKIILVKRNCFDVLYSMINKNIFWPESPKTLDDAIRLYKSYNVTFNSIEFDYIINYEDLWNNPFDETYKLFDFLGLGTEDIDKIIHKTLFGGDLPENLKSVFRKGVPGQGCEFFNSKQRDKIIRSIL